MLTVEEYLDEVKKGKYKEIIKPYSKVSLEIRFDKIYDDEKFKKINVFNIKKKQAYYGKENQDIYLLFINYFINVVDTDNELIAAYTKVKTMVDRKTKLPKEVFEDMLMEYVLSDSIKEKIFKMTDANYSYKLVKSNKFRNAKLEFNDMHGYYLLSISRAIDLVLPLVTHYIHVMNIDNTDKYLFRVYRKVFDRFKTDEIDIYNKICEHVRSLSNKTKSKDNVHWEKIKITGEDLDTKLNTIVLKIVTDIIYKFIYQKNIVALITRTIKRNIGWALKEKHQLNLREISNKRQDDGLSDLDKIEMTMSKFDETRAILSPINTRMTLDLLCEKYDIEITNKEVQYYMDNIQIEKFQKDLLYQFLGKYLYNINDAATIEKSMYCKYVIVMKNILDLMNFRVLQHALTAVVEPQKGTIPKKYLNMIENSKDYKEIKEKYKHSFDILTKKDNIFFEYIKILINYNFYLVDYDNREATGQKIANNKKKIKNLLVTEFLKFVNNMI